MGIAEESTEKIISVSFQAASVTANILLQVLKSLSEVFKQKNQSNQTNITLNMNQGQQVGVNAERGQQVGVSLEQKQQVEINMMMEKKVKVKTGKMNLRDLSGKGPMDYLDISNKKEFKSIENQCKTHHIDYAVLKSKTEPPTYSIFFQAKDTAILEKMLDNAINEMEQQEKQKMGKEQPGKENPNKENLKEEATQEQVANASEKNRETMGKEEREKEEPIKKPKTEQSMPVNSNEPKAPTTDSVKQEKKRESASQIMGDKEQGGSISNKIDQLDNKGLPDVGNRMSSFFMEQTKIEESMGKNGRYYSFQKLTIAASNKKELDKQNLSVPKKHINHDSLEK